MKGHVVGVWTGVDKHASTSDLKQKYSKLRSHGVNSVFLGGGLDDREFEIVKDAGLDLHAWMWGTNRNEPELRTKHPEWFMVSRTGKSCANQPPYVDYYRWLSPVIPEVRTYLAEKTAELASHDFVDGVHLDYIRYPDVILPRGLWEHYHLDQTEELPDYDFCYSQATRAAFKAACGRDPLEIENPAIDQEWLHFRYDSITKLVKELSVVTREHSKDLTAAVFPTPSHARKICRQNWDKWPLQAACPMIYHSFYNEGIEWVGECVRENIQAATFPIVAGLYMPAFKDPAEFEKGVRLALHRGSAGVSLFGDVHDEYWAALGRTGLTG